MFKYILFDFDGTLIDTNELIILALHETSLKFLDKTLSSDELNSILGKHLEQQMKCLSELHYKEMILFYKDFYSKNKDTMIKEFPSINQMLKSIKELGCKTAIVSAKGRGGIEHGLKLFGMEDYFDIIISAYDIENNKPHPEPAIKALSALNGSADAALLIGDSPYDILCGKNAGVKTALVDWTIFPKDNLMSLKPDYYIKTPDELVKIVKGSKV
ncbi:MAG: HAD-IA family hydrolase [Clostridia bacterium]|nr:HAD-IA family hydrolase [Clostridia bacterium]